MPVYGWVSMSRQEHPVRFDSALERDFYVLLDFQQTVALVEEKPVKIPYARPGGSLSHYTPCALVRYEDRAQRRAMLCEIKSRQQLHRDWSRLRPKFKAAVHLCRQEGWIFKIYTEREICTEYLANVKFLRPLRFMAVDELKKARIARFLNDRGEATLRDVLMCFCPQMYERGAWLSLIWHLIATGCIEADLSRRLGYSSVLRWR